MANILDSLRVISAAQKKQWQRLLYEAAIANNPAKIQQLVRKGAYVDGRYGMLERTMLIHAVRTNSLDAAKALLESGATIDLADDDQNTALHIAAANGLPKMVDLLTKSGANPDIKNKHGKTALMVAIENGQNDIAQRLVGLGANIHISSPNGMSALHMAILSGNHKIVGLLLAHGANLHQSTKNGPTAITLAHKLGRPLVLEAIQTHISLQNSKKLHRIQKKRQKPPQSTRF